MAHTLRVSRKAIRNSPCGKCGAVPPFKDGSRCHPHRINPKLGYVEGNVVPRCPKCHAKESGHNPQFIYSAHNAGQKVAARLRGKPGRRWARMTRRKASATHTGQPKPWLRGHPLTDAQKRALDLGRRPESYTPARLAKMSAAQKGKPRPWQIGHAVSDATKEKISAAQRGKPKRSNHTRWHVKRNRKNPRCQFCKSQ